MEVSLIETVAAEHMQMSDHPYVFLLPYFYAQTTIISPSSGIMTLNMEKLICERVGKKLEQ